MPTKATFRRDPRNTGKGFSTYHGFTVIELMITIAVLAIITSLALPSYRTLVEKRQVTSGAEQISAFLSSAQLEAVKRNEPMAVNLTRTDSDTWCIGIDANSDSCDCTATSGADACMVDGALRIFSDANVTYPNVLSYVGGTTTFYFDPVRGIVYQGDLGSDEPFEGADLALISDQGTYGLNVGITITGRVKICSNASKHVSGFADCAEAEEES